MNIKGNVEGSAKTINLQGGWLLRVFAQISKWQSKHKAITATLLICLALAISASWLVFPYFVKGQKLLGDVGSTLKLEKLTNSISIGKFLTRSSFGKGEAQVDVLYATPKYFEITDHAQVVTQYRPDQYLVFFVTETTHIEDLPTQLPVATLRIGDEQYESIDVEGPLEVYHHRVVSIRFPAFDDSKQAIIKNNSDKLRLELASQWDPDGGIRSFEWALPLQYPDNIQTHTAWTPLMVLGVSSGLLSFVLTPCLLQLLVVYLMTLSGFSSAQLQSGTAISADRRSKNMITLGLAFVIGFSLLFTLTGAAIGYAGKAAQMFFAIWSSKISVAAGILVILMGLWVGIRARAPLVCRLIPERLIVRAAKPNGYLGSALTAVGFSLGCLTCFGGAIIATLLIYVGALGSAFVGAMVMFSFSLGIVIPFLLAAFFLSRAVPLIDRLSHYAPTIGLVSMLVIVAFGLVLVSDNFHVLSDFIYPYLGLN